jgi:hypothetical protein
MTKIGLYLVKFAKYAVPTDPRPRDAKIRPPLQQRDAATAEKMDVTLMSFSFIGHLQTHRGYSFNIILT